ncbi:hypothetical protein Slin15195_G028390 [Septoria linicola]|uniref:Uncharacterized protein n=1 Tax=Septoria linicola TaxID=215465 RepID=A0A9Q9AI61_9PEZI|nr:hypothetical protein Slin15195_G028390 [Septoria linicola]
MSPRTQDALGRKAGRFDPSEPLHMTTRHAAKKGRPNGTPSVNGSVEDDESRRGSIDAIRPATGQSLSGQPSPQARRTSGTSANSSMDIILPSDTQRSTGKRVAKETSQLPVSPTQNFSFNASQSPSRKRKRTYSPPHITTGNISSANSTVLLHATEKDLDSLKDVVVIVPEDHLSDRESRGSSSDQDVDRYIAAAQSTEITPAATPIGSEPVSPVSGDTNPTPRYPAKQIDVVMADADHPAEEDELDDVDEDDVPAAIDDADDLADADADDDEDHAVAGPRKRLTGRRRADHHEIEIEAIMRRQLQLKSSYRSIARVLKPILAEIASKTVEELETNSILHQQVIEYEGTSEHAGIQKLLDAALANRKRQLDAQVACNREQLRKRFVAEKEVRRGFLTYEVDNMRQKRVDDMEYELLRIARSAQLEKGDGQEVTDDEDGDVLPKPRQTGYRLTRGPPLDTRHESRSRKALETERAIEDMQRRFEMHRMMQEAQEKDDVQAIESFTVMDSTAREAAHARREGVKNTNILAAAAAEVDRLAKIPIIPNNQALGLQLLGDLASRPSLRASALAPPATPRRLGEPFTSAFDQAQMRPPSSFATYQKPNQNSPDTAQWVEHALPISPRRFSRRESHLERPRWEPSMRSPPTRTDNRLSTFPALASLLQSPSLNFPGRHEVFRNQHHRQQSHDGLQHHRNSSQTPIHHQRHLSQESPQVAPFGMEGSRPSLSGAVHRDHSTWQKYQHPPTSESESRAAQQRPSHEFSRGGPLSIERLAPQHETGPAERMESTTDKSMEPAAAAHSVSQSQTQSNADYGAQSEGEVDSEEEVKPAKLPSPSPSEPQARRDDSLEQPSSESAADHCLKDDEASLVRARDPSEDVQARKPRSRASSPGQSTTPDLSGSQDGDRGQRRHGKDVTQHLGKTSKAERNGLSRKAHKEAKRLHKRTSNNMRHGAEGGSQMFRFRLNTMESSKPSTFGARTSTGTSHATQSGSEPPYPPLPSYNQPPPPPGGFPPQYGPFPPQFYPHDAYSPRNSLPGPGAPAAPPWPASGFSHPPMGPPPDNWPAGTPPQANGPQPPGPPHSSPFGSQYGGPAIAPATPDPRFPYGTGPPGGNHPPAFAQQQRNSEGNGSRRRTQSDAPRQTKFHHYAGPRNR